MRIVIDNVKFTTAHRAFEQHMLRKSNGVPFSNFQHPFLVDDEISYKWKIYRDGKDALHLDRWKSWSKQPGRIISAVKAACSQKVSQNLLVHRFGQTEYSETALYRVKSEADKRGLEDKLYNLFFGGASTPVELGRRFDELATYLRENQLGCKWPFLTYLCFLLDPTVYFPMRPDSFDVLLEYFGIDKRLSRNVNWERYLVLLQLADALRSQLVRYGQLDAVEIQSYMWVVSYLIKEGAVSRAAAEPEADVDFQDELERRGKKARERERVGIKGEQLVYEQEVQKLKNCGRADLARKVRLVSADDEDFGFDVRSFESNGSELHIEVKTTTRTRGDDSGFWLSGAEKARAAEDDCWLLYRVSDIDRMPEVNKLGNIVKNNDPNWELSVSTWFVKPKLLDTTA